jgi:hypothetical protein
MRVWGNLGLMAAAALALSGCVHGANNPNALNTMYLDRYAGPNPTPGHFTVCHGFSCTEKKQVALSSEQWKRVAATFAPRATTARQERAQIARAVALVQTFVGPQTGTNVRQWTHRNLYVLPNLGDLSQLDCIDTAVNTWTYMTMMERGGLLRFHKVVQLSAAGSVTDPNVRNTAVLQQIEGSDYFAIDASLVDHNEPPLVMPLSAWLGQWPPDPKVIERVARVDAEPTRTVASASN